MDYIDLEDGHPKEQGIYDVKIKTTTGKDRLCRASWVNGKGFKPIAERLLPDEYIYAWKKK